MKSLLLISTLHSYVNLNRSANFSLQQVPYRAYARAQHNLTVRSVTSLGGDAESTDHRREGCGGAVVAALLTSPRQRTT